MFIFLDITSDAMRKNIEIPSEDRTAIAENPEQAVTTTKENNLLQSRILRGTIPLIIIVLTKILAGLGPLYYFLSIIYMIPICIHMMYHASIRKGNEFIYLKERIFLERIRTTRIIPYTLSIIASLTAAIILPGLIFFMTLVQLMAFIVTIPITYIFMRLITMDRVSKFKHNAKTIMLSGRKQLISSFFACAIYPLFQILFISIGVDNSEYLMYTPDLVPIASWIGTILSIINEFTAGIINTAENTGLGMLAMLIIVYSMGGGFAFFMILKFFSFFFFDSEKIRYIRLSVRDVAGRIIA